MYVRDWLYVEDHCSAIRAVLARGRVGETYCVGGRSEKPNLEIVGTICKLLDRLHAKSGQTLGELCEGLDMSRQAVTKHLVILEDANLVATKKEGREKFHFINPVPINDIAERWIGKFEEHKLRALSDLKRKLEAKSDG